MAAIQRFRPEPPFTHGQPPVTAVLLCNLGTPDAPTPGAVRRYLREFLWDRRVVEIPRALWWVLLHGPVLMRRPRESAARYASIWGPNGSPLLHWTRVQALALQQWLAGRGHQVLVRHAMRYGHPGVASELDALRLAGATRVLVLPAYPQYSATTTASLFDAVARWGTNARHLPELRFVNRYHDDALYIAALARRVQAHWSEHGRGEHLVLSFHGLPARNLALGDPYHCECLKTARLLAQALRLEPSQWTVTFQSRFGRAEWLQPYTEPTLCGLARSGVRHVDVFCPGFTADCVETLEEIGQECRQAFLQAGGQRLEAIACLNDLPEWIAALGALAERHLAGWPTREPDLTELAASRDRALAKGAAR